MTSANSTKRTAVAGVLALTWPIVVILFLLGCVVGPDGRRTLSPGARAFGQGMAQDVIACGLPFAFGAVLGAIGGTPPSDEDYLGIAECHFRRVGERLGSSLELAPVPTVEHGRDVVEAIRVRERAGHVVVDVDDSKAAECEEAARARVVGGPR